MILVDTSVWIDHLRKGNPVLSELLEGGNVLIHPFVLGELVCGNLKNRWEVLKLLSELPQAPVAMEAEVLEFIESRSLMGRGIGYIDVHLLAATALEGFSLLWTFDKRLAAVSDELGMFFNPDR